VPFCSSTARMAPQEDKRRSVTRLLDRRVVLLKELSQSKKEGFAVVSVTDAADRLPCQFILR